LLESLLVAVAGLGFALAANGLSPRGLQLTRNYFPGGKPLPPTAPILAIATSGPAATNVPSTSEVLAAQLKAKGLGLVESDEVLRLFRDPGFEQGTIVFVDARDDDHYQDGHIPGAYQLDYYHPADYLGAVLNACSVATQIVVYCNGGECTDSQLAASFLHDSAGVPKEKLFVYEGGIKEWERRSLPIELGARKSGNLRGASK
jgi:rhodanese-related sulfurtransferase